MSAKSFLILGITLGTTLVGKAFAADPALSIYELRALFAIDRIQAKVDYSIKISPATANAIRAQYPQFFNYTEGGQRFIETPAHDLGRLNDLVKAADPVDRVAIQKQVVELNSRSQSTLSELKAAVAAHRLTPFQMQTLEYAGGQREINIIPKIVFHLFDPKSGNESQAGDYHSIRVDLGDPAKVAHSPLSTDPGTLLHEAAHTQANAGLVAWNILPGSRRQTASVILSEGLSLTAEFGKPTFEVLRERYASAWKKLEEYFPGFDSLKDDQRLELLEKIVSDHRLARDIPTPTRVEWVATARTSDGSRARQLIEFLQQKAKAASDQNRIEQFAPPSFHAQICRAAISGH